MSILREVFVKLGLSVDAQSFAKGQLAAEGIKLIAEKAVDGMRELAQTFIENINQTAEYSEQVKALSTSTGINTTRIQQLGKAAAQEGISLDNLGVSLTHLTRNMLETKSGGGDAADMFKRLGVHATDAHGKLRPTDQVLLDLSDKFSKMEESGEKGALVMKLFGRSAGPEMAELLDGGREALQKYFEASVMSPEQIKAGKEVGQIQKALAAQTKDLWRSAIGPLLPAIRDLLKQYLSWKKENAEIMKQNIARFLSLGITVVKDLGKAFVGLTSTLKFFSDNWKPVLALVLAGLAGWAAANFGLVVSFIAVQAAAVGAAIVAGAAWLVAAAPFIALGAVVGGILLLFDDIRTYSDAISRGGTGKNTLFGQFLIMIDKMATGGGARPWWLSALLTAKEYLTDILSIMRDLGWAKKPGSDGPAYKVAQNPEAAERIKAYSAQHPEQQYMERKGLAKFFRGDLVTQAEFARSSPLASTSVPTLPPPSNYGQSVQPGGPRVGSLTFQISGNDPKAIRKEVADHLESLGIVTAADVDSAAADASYSQ